MHSSIAQVLYFSLQTLRREPVLRVFRELKKSQWFSKDELEHIQFVKMKRLIKFSYEHVPFYNQLYRKAGIHPNDIRQPSDTRWLPIVDREMIQGNLSALMGRRVPCYPAKTAGTTGQSLSLKIDNVSWAFHHANIFRTLSWYGVVPRAREARIWGRRIDSAAQRQMQIKDLLFNRLRLNAFDIHREATHFARKLLRLKPEYIYGYPSAICDFIECLKDLKIVLAPLPLKVVACSADEFTSSQRQLIENFFETRSADIYGAAEVGIIASQCPEGGRHIPIESIWVHIEGEEEVVPGKISGEVVLTDLNNYSMPIIRYSIGDRSYLESASCGCGRPLPLLGPFQGRKLEFIETSDGRKVNSVLTYYLFKGLESRGIKLKQYQLVQEAPEKFNIRLVVTDRIKKSDQNYLIETLKYFIGVNIRVSVETTDYIPPLPSGKYAIFVSKLRDS